MATKTLRVIRESKLTGNFTREQIDRAIRQVEHPRANGGENRGAMRSSTTRPVKSASARR